MAQNTKSYQDKLTTIAIPMALKEELQQYGLKGESYSDILARLLKSAHERLLRDVLMNEEGCVTIEEALAEAEKKMAKVIISEELREKIFKKFQGQSVEIFKLLYSLKESPHKGKVLGQVNGVLIKELKYESFRFYFLVDGYLIKVMEISDLTDILIKFVAMSDKKGQQKTIEEIKNFLRKFGKEAFS